MSHCNVNLATGDVYHFHVDARCRLIAPFQFIRLYDSGLRSAGPFGDNWTHNHVRYLVPGKDDGTYFRPPEPPVVAKLNPEGLETRLNLSANGNEATLTDGAGNRLTFLRHTRNSTKLWLSSRQDPFGNRIDYEYLNEGIPNRVTHSAGIRIEMTENTFSRIEQLRVIAGQRVVRQVEYIYEGSGNLAIVVLPNGGRHGFSYKGGLLNRHTNPLGGSTHFEYDKRRRCEHVYRSDGREERLLSWNDLEMQMDYHAPGQLGVQYGFRGPGMLAFERDALGVKKEYIYDESNLPQFVNVDGRPQKVTLFFPESGMLMENFGPVTYIAKYDRAERLIETISPCGAKWLYRYDGFSNRTEATDPNGGVWRFQYDEGRWLYAAQDPRGYWHRRLRPTRDELVFEDDLGTDLRIHFNPTGLATALVDGLGHTTRFRYLADNLSEIEYADGSTVGFNYDPAGNLVKFTDELGNPIEFAYDSFGAPTSVTDSLSRTSKFFYNADNNLIEVSNASGETAKMEYSAGNNLSGVEFFDGRSEFYIHSKGGDAEEVRDGHGELLVRLERDDIGRVVRRLYPDKSECRYAWGAQSQLMECENEFCKVTVEWTPGLQIASEQTGDFFCFYKYDEAGNRASLRTSSGREIRYHWDQRNRLTQVIDNHKTEYSFSYDQGNLFSEWRGPEVKQIFRFDNRNRMVSRVVQRSGNGEIVASRQYAYNRAGWLTLIEDSIVGVIKYEYLPNGALRGVLGPGSNIELYDYDLNDNLLQSPAGNHTYLKGDRVANVGQRRYDYDNRGRVSSITTRDESWSLSYDHSGMLRQARAGAGETSRYAYDPFGRRIEKIGPAGKTTYRWDQNTYLSRETDQGVAEFLFLPNTFLPLGITAGENHYSYILDQIGTPVAYFGREGLCPVPYMKSFGSSPSIDRVPNEIAPFRFQGQYYDSETGFHYNFSRYYDPIAARYVAPDPIGFRGGGNLYRYTTNPLLYVDPYALLLSNGVLTILPICQWSDEQMKDANKKMNAMNAKLKPKGILIPTSPVQRCGKTAKDIYEDCQKKVAASGAAGQPNLNESSDKCFNEQADHIIEICAGGSETDCGNLQPLNESVNKSYGSQVAHAVRSNPGALLQQVKLSQTECNDNPNVDC